MLLNEKCAYHHQARYIFKKFCNHIVIVSSSRVSDKPVISSNKKMKPNDVSRIHIAFNDLEISSIKSYHAVKLYADIYMLRLFDSFLFTCGFGC